MVLAPRQAALPAEFRSPTEEDIELFAIMAGVVNPAHG
jgi:hypothetical protein